MGGFQTGGMWGETNTSTQTTTGNAATVKSALKDASPTYKAACDKTKKAAENKEAAVKKKNDALDTKEYKDAKKKADDSKTAYDKNQNDQSTKKTEIKKVETRVDTADDRLAAAKDAKEAKDKRIAELEKDGSPEAQAAATVLKNDTTVETELTAAEKEKTEADSDLKTKEGELKTLEEAEDGLETTMDADAKAFEEQQETIDAIDEEIKQADEALDDAIVAENKTLDEIAEEYPETVGPLADAFKETIASDKKEAAKIASEKAKAEKAKTDAEAAAEEKKLADAQRPKDLEKVKNTPPDKDGMLLSAHYDVEAAAKCTTRACLDKLMKDAKVKMEIARIKQLQNELEFATDPKRAAEIAARLKAAKAVPGVEEALNPGVAAALLGGAGISSKSGELIWDSPKAAVDMGGRLDDLIKDHMQPKYKHAYLGEFPGKLEALDWMVKSMDRPKIDVEYVEQVRNNVKRQYPVKYSFGDISFTFWDNVEHKTIKTLHEYFTGKVWQHFSVSGSGFMLLRDSTIIPKLVVWDLSVSGEDNLKYCFENCSLASFDFDANEDETDEGVHTIQAVFKFERYNVLATKATPRVLGMKSVTWM